MELVEGGTSMAVTESNKRQYVTLLTALRAMADAPAQTRAFVEGLHEVVPPCFLRVFSPAELVELVAGRDGPLCVADWRAHTNVTAFATDSQVPIWFFDALEKMSPNARRRLLRFSTGCSGTPVGGFEALARVRKRNGDHGGAFTLAPLDIPDRSGSRIISSSSSGCDGDVGADERQADTYLPHASTCFNTLRLPPYSSKCTLIHALNRLDEHLIAGASGFQCA